MNVTDLIARLRDCAALSPRDKDRHEAADALEAQAQALEAYRVKTDSLRWEHGELESRLATAERDAERYRRLRVDPSLVVGPSYVLRRTDELDAAIDAAMEGK